MSDYSFFDPQSQEEVSFDWGTVPYWHEASALANPEQHLLVLRTRSSRAQYAPEDVFVSPHVFPFAVSPVLCIAFVPLNRPVGRRRFKIRGTSGLVASDWLKSMHIRGAYEYPWCRNIWDNYITPLCLGNALYYIASLCYIHRGFSMTGIDVNAPGSRTFNYTSEMRDENSRSSAPLSPIAELLFSIMRTFWEQDRISQHARTEHAIELGVCRAMGEDKFAKICKKAGFRDPIPKDWMMQARKPPMSQCEPPVVKVLTEPSVSSENRLRHAQWLLKSASSDLTFKDPVTASKLRSIAEKLEQVCQKSDYLKNQKSPRLLEETAALVEAFKTGTIIPTG